MRNQRGEAILLMFILITLAMVFAGGSAAYLMKCDPSVQHCVENPK